MNKEINNDANLLIQYFKDYRLERLISNQDFVSEFRKIHKKAFGYLVVFSEMEKQNEEKNIFERQSLLYLKESVSDVLQSFFTWANGAYKAADLLLRSSIENFNKAIIGNVNVDVYTEKSVYKIFDMTEKMKEYSAMIGKETVFVLLHRIYSELCKTSHTATDKEMDHISALKLLPQYNKDKAIKYRENFELLIDAYLGFFLANYKGFVDSMYRTNVDIFYDVISKNIIRSVVNEKKNSCTDTV